MRYIGLNVLFFFVFCILLAEHFGFGEPSLEIGGRLSAGESRRGETQPHTTGPRVANKFADLGHGHNETTGILEKIQRKFCGINRHGDGGEGMRVKS